MKPPLFAFGLLIAVLTGLRLWLAGAEEWSANEAYLYLISRHLEWAYYEGPSGVPALMRLSELLFGPTPLGLRLPGVLFSLLATGAVVFAGRVVYSTTTGLWAAIFLNLLPVFNLAALRADATLAILTGWVLLAALTWRALHSGRLRDWLMVGACAAAGTALSYDFLPALMAVPLATAASPKFRRQFRRPGIYLSLGVWLAGTLAIWFWNARHEWISFSGQTLLLLRTFAGDAAFRAMGETGLYFTPLPLLLLAAGLITAGYLGVQHQRPRWILVFAGLPALLMLHRLYRGESADAFGLAALALIALFVAQLLLDPELLPPLHRRPLFSGVLTAVALMFLAALGSTAGQLSAAARTQSDLAWGALMERLERAQTLHHPAGERPFFFIAGNRDLASGLGFYLVTQRGPVRDFPPVYIRESQDMANQFGLWPRYDEIVKGSLPDDPTYTEEGGTNPNLGRNALYLGYEPRSELPQPISAGFEKISELEKIEPDSGPPLYLYLCENYQMAPL